MKPKKPKYIHVIKFRCTKCERDQQVEVHEGMHIEVGTVIYPYSGGGEWGKCRFCKAGGLRALDAPELPKQGPVGWRLPK